MTTIISSIVKAHFAASDEQIEALAAQVVLGEQSDGTYLRVLIAHVQKRLGKPKRGKQPSQEPVLDTIHEALYPAVLRGVGPADLDNPERNRRATFARSAASTVRFYLRNGGDIRALDPAEVTKTGLRRLAGPEQPVPTGTRTEKAFTRAEQTVLRLTTRLVKEDPGRARQRIEMLLGQLEQLMPQEAFVERRRAHERPSAQAH